MLQLRRRAGGIHAHDHARRRVDAELRLHPFAAVLAQDADVIACLQTQIDKACGGGLHDLLQPGPGDLVPDPEFLLPHRHAGGAVLGMVVHHAHQRREVALELVECHHGPP